MSNIHHIFGEGEPRPQPRIRGPYRKKATAADIARAIRTAEQLGLTIYGFTVEGEKVHLQTKPGPDAPPRSASMADDWFSRRG